MKRIRTLFDPLRAGCALASLAFVLAPAPISLAADPDFPEPESLRPAVAFWMRVYLEATTDGGFIHDHDHLGVVYEKIRFEGKSGKAERRHRDDRKAHWRDALRRLAKNPTPRNEDEANVLRDLQVALGRKPSARDLRDASGRIRFQRGQRDKFRDGLIKSGAYEDAMRDIFRRAGLPQDLAYLPHVESSFNVHAYSKYGAAGAWQFMRSTGARYMRIDYDIDERLDPIVATHAAARLLGENYGALQSWPLALTAYNHGRAGMMRAKSQHGPNIDVIVREYKGRTFGFASRNFYAQFVAARRIMRSYDSYFAGVERHSPEAIVEVELPFYASVADVVEHLGVPRSVIKEYNPALRQPIHDGSKRIPKGYRLRVPAGVAGADHAAWVKQIPSDRRYAEQKRSRYYKVQRGDTLSRIAQRFDTSTSELKQANNLRSSHRIYIGQVLRLPDSGAPEPTPAFALVREAQAAPAVPTPKPKPRGVAPAPPVAKPLSKPVEEANPIPEPQAETEIRTASASLPTPKPRGMPAAEAAEPPRPLPKPALPADSPWREVRNGTITVDSSETLGHYAEWLGISASRLRRLNGIKQSANMRLGQRVKLDFSRVDVATFVERRNEFHKAIEEDFFGSFEVVGTQEHRVRSGDNIWLLSNREYGVPTWLIHRYNPTVDLARLTPGLRLIIPVVERQ